MRHEIYHVLAPMGLESKHAAAQELVSNYDPRLIVAWMDEQEHWGVYGADQKGVCYLVHEVSDEQDGYRDLAECDIEQIASLDNARSKEAIRRLRRIDDNNRDLKLKHQRDRIERIGEIAKDHWRSVFGIPYITAGIDFKG